MINSKIKKKINKRIYSQENQAKFKHDLQNFEWSILNNSPDVNSMYSKFIIVVQNLYDKSFPLTSKTVIVSDKHRPWITRAIKKSIAKKHVLYKK